MAPMKNSHVLAALLLLVAATATIGYGAEGAITPTIVSATKALVFGIVPCSTGSSINVVIAPPFANASLQLQCGVPALSRSIPVNIAEREGRRTSRGPAVVSLGVIRNSSGNGGGLLSSMLLANQCSVVVTTPLPAYSYNSVVGYPC